jgi:hypothetical protein
MLTILKAFAERLLEYVIDGVARRIADAIIDWIDGHLAAAARPS